MDSVGYDWFDSPTLHFCGMMETKLRMNETTPKLRLDDFLKMCGVVATGGHAKLLIQGGDVLVNGEVETRRRKQLVVGDRVELMGEVFEVTSTVPDEE